MSAHQRQILASKTAEEREARLQQMSAHQRQRLASETAKLYSAAMTWTQGPDHHSCRFVDTYMYLPAHANWLPCYALLTLPFLQGLTQVEMLISSVLPITSLYQLPHGQYAYSGHVINLPQDVASFVNSLPLYVTAMHVCTHIHMRAART